MNKKSYYFVTILLLVSIIGLYDSLEVVFRRPIDPDMFSSVLVWDGLKSTGIRWLHDWRFTQDNWLFSLVPFQILVVKASSNLIESILFFGWAIYIFAAIVCGLIAKELGAKKGLFFIISLMLIFNVYGLLDGHIVYSVSHNITNLYGLVTVWLALKWLKRPNWFLASLVCFFQLIAGLSDPWLLPTYTLPLILALLGTGIEYKGTDSRVSRWCFLLAAMLFAIGLLIKSRFWGQLTFMPFMHFAVGDQETLINNIYYLVRNLGGLFALIFPFWDNGILWPETQFLYSSISCLIVFGLSFYCLGFGYVLFKDKGYRFFLVFALFSIGGICLAYVLSDLRGTLSSRFLINVVYVLPIGLVVFFERRWSRLSNFFKFAAVGTSLAYVVSSIASYHLNGFIESPDWVSNRKELTDWIETLDKNGLTYGYGPYHGSKSNAISVVTKGRIKIRPVVFDQNTGEVTFTHAQTHPDWYTEKDVPKGQDKYFFFLPKNAEGCPDYDKCRNSLIKKFGDPMEEISFKNGSLLVWDHPLVNWGDRQPLAVKLNSIIKFDNTEPRPVWSGWARPESWGTWSEGERAHALFKFSEPVNSDINVRLIAHAYAPSIGLNQRVSVYANGQEITVLNFTPENNRAARNFVVPNSLLNGVNLLKLEFEVEGVFSPKDMNISPDTRRLGIGVSEMSFQTQRAN